MGSMLLAAVPSKSSKNTSRIHNPLAFPRHAISTLTPSKCGPIYRRNGRYILRVLVVFLLSLSLSPLFFGTLFLCKATLATIGVRVTRREEGKKATQWEAAVRLMDPQFKCIEGKYSGRRNLFDLQEWGGRKNRISCTSACALIQRQPRDFSINFSFSG